MEQHRQNPACANCHASMDPLGFAFENFDAIGRWRIEEVTDGTGSNPKVSSSGKLVDGREYRDSKEFKQLLLKDMDAFQMTFLEKLATFGMRRTLGLADREELKKIASQSKSLDFQLSKLLESFVCSDLFQSR